MRTGSELHQISDRHKSQDTVSENFCQYDENSGQILESIFIQICDSTPHGKNRRFPWKNIASEMGGAKKSGRVLSLVLDIGLTNIETISM